MEDKIAPIYKPVGLSSYDLIRKFKKDNDYSGKIGHAGTLDPFAAGLVLLLLGKATKKFNEINKWDKTYLAGLRLGAVSNTGDPEGQIKQISDKKPTLDQIKKSFKSFIGQINQKVPAYSAAKHQGSPLYKLARQGKKIEKSKMVEIKDIKLISYKYPLLSLEITCSSGT
jgi:tRNA pseudouridine55 synthase